MSLLDRYHAALRTKLAEVRSDNVEALASGGAGDYPYYRERVGYIRAIDQMLNGMDEIKAEIMGEDDA